MFYFILTNIILVISILCMIIGFIGWLTARIAQNKSTTTRRRRFTLFSLAVMLVSLIVGTNIYNWSVQRAETSSLAVDVLVFVVVCIVVLFVSRVVNQSRKNAKAQAEAKEANANDAIDCTHIAGLGVGASTTCRLWTFEDRIQIDAMTSTFNIPIDRLRAAEIKSEQELREVDRSVIGRAIVGNLLVPGLGAIIGGMTGLKPKKQKSTNHYFILNYQDQQGELKGITFQDNLNIVRIRQFVSGINQHLTSITHKKVIDL